MQNAEEDRVASRVPREWNAAAISWDWLRAGLLARQPELRLKAVIF